ncbi:hypothetical protein, partial [Actinomadura bangladeshensis]|uniref:hypothetical protein n=1 Tax=Actinomadura bangladeshensis TaxID=453573 RepID=UPI001FB6F7B7
MSGGLVVGLEDLPGGGLRARGADAGGVAVLLRGPRVVTAFRLVALIRWLWGNVSGVLVARVLGALFFAGLVRAFRLAGLR